MEAEISAWIWKQNPQVSPSLEQLAHCHDQTQLESKVNLLTPGCGERKCSALLQGTEKEYRWLNSKPQTPRWLSRKDF